MSDGPDGERLKALEVKLEAASKAREPGTAEEHHISGAQAGWRMVTELVVGLLMGFGVGYGMDHVFGTIPIFLIIMTMLGFAAGVRAMMRSAEEIAAKHAAEAAKD